MAPFLAAITASEALRDTTAALAEFEESMAQVRGIAIKTTSTFEEQEAQFKTLSDLARSLGASTRFSATQAAEGQLFLARAGFSVQQIVEALPATLNLATAGVLELGRASDIVTNVMSQFGIAATDLSGTVDVLVATANSSNTSVDQLALALEYAGPFARALNVSLEEVAAAVGVLGDNAIQASSAGTNLRGIFAQLINPVGESAEVLQRVAARAGATVDAFDITKNSLTDVISTFAKGGATAQEMETVFGRLNVSAAIALTNMVGKLRDLSAANEEVEGTAQRLSDIQNDTLRGSMLRLKSATENLQLALGDQGLRGVLRSTFDTLGGVFRELGGAATDSDRASAAIQILASAIRGLLATMVAFAALKFAVVLFGVGQAFLAAATSAAAFNIAMRANPILLVATGIGIAVTALLEFTSASKDAKSSVEALAEANQTLASSISSVTDAQGRQNLARRKKDLEGEIDAIRAEIFALEELQAKISILQKKGSGPIVSLDIAKKIAPDIDFAELEAELRSEAVRVIESAVTGLTIKPSFNLDEAFEVGGVNKSLSLVIAQLERINSLELFKVSDSLENEAKALADAATAVAQNTKLVGVPVERVLSIVDAQIEGAKSRIDKIREEVEKLAQQKPSDAAATAPVADPEDVQDAKEKLKLFETELDFRFRIAGATRDEQQLQAQLRSAKELAVRAGLDPAEIAAKVSAIETTERLIQSIEKEGEAQRDADEARRKALGELLRFTEALRREREETQLSAAEKEVLQKVEEGLAIARAAGIENLDAVADRIRTEVTLRQNIQTELEKQTAAEQALAEEQSRRQANLEQNDEYLQSIRDEIELLKLSRNEQMQYAAATRLSADATDAQKEELAELVNELDRQQQVRALADDMANAFGDAFRSIIAGTSSLRDALGGLVSALSNALVEALVIKPLIDQLSAGFGAGGIAGALLNANGRGFSGAGSPLAFAKGGAIGGAGGVLPFHRGGTISPSGSMVHFARGGALGSLGQAVPFEKGGMLDELGQVIAFALGGLPSLNQVPDFSGGPQAFSMSNGRVGILREKGPEFIMPAVRMPDGKLGVQSTSGPARPNVTNATTNYHTHNYIVKSDPDNFRLNPRQVQRRASSKFQHRQQ